MALTLIRCPRQCGTLGNGSRVQVGTSTQIVPTLFGINDCDGFVGVWVHLCCPAADKAVVLEVRYCEASAMEDEGGLWQEDLLMNCVA